MDLTLYQFAAVGAILFGASVLQGTVGFASGMFGIPLLLFAGMSLPEAITINLIAATLQNIVGVLALRRETDFAATLRPILIRLAMLPVGVCVLYLSGSLGNQSVKQIVGAALLVILIMQAVSRARSVDRLHPAWEWLAFGVSGFMAGFLGMGGAAMVLWVSAHKWSPGRARGFQFFVFLSGMGPQAVLLWLLFGNTVFSALCLGLLGIPMVVLGTAVGLGIGKRLPHYQMRRATYAVLVLIALSAIVAPMLPGLLAAMGVRLSIG